MTLVYLNGQFFTDPAGATLSAFDAGLQHGVGLFETLLAVGPVSPGGPARIHRLAEHLLTLEASVRSLGLAHEFNAEPLAELLFESLRRYGLSEPAARARIRLTLTGGDLNLLQSGTRPGHQPTLMIVVQPPTPYPAEMFSKGVRVTLSDLRLNPLDPFESHKTLNYWRRLASLQDAASKGAAEAIALQVSNHLAGGCVSNLILVRGGELHTPIARGEEPKGALPSPVRPGVTRGAILELAGEVSLSVHRRMLAIGDLLDADEAFLTNSSWGVLPVTQVESKTIGTGEPGPVTRSLRGAWLNELGEPAR